MSCELSCKHSTEHGCHKSHHIAEDIEQPLYELLHPAIEEPFTKSVATSQHNLVRWLPLCMNFGKQCRPARNNVPLQALSLPLSGSD